MEFLLFILPVGILGFGTLCWFAYLDHKTETKALDFLHEFFKSQDENKDSRK